MSRENQVDRAIGAHRIAAHPLWRDLAAGTLPRAVLRAFATQHFHFLRAWAASVTATAARAAADATLCAAARTAFAPDGDGIDGASQAELWLRFAEGLGVPRFHVEDASLLPETEDLIGTYGRLSAASLESGIGAALAYVCQQPALARSALAALERAYGLSGEWETGFFRAQARTDAGRADALLALAERADAGAVQEAARALWASLDGVERLRPALRDL